MTTSAAREKLIIALDVVSCDDARRLVDHLGDEASFYKIGYRLAFSGGLELARELIRNGYKVFLDLKLHDIGNTVEEGVRALSEFGATFLTVHAYPQTMRAAVKGAAGSDLKILGVTVLTSYDEWDMKEAGYSFSPSELVIKRALQAKEAGMDGLVCSAAEVAQVRGLTGPSLSLVTPGIRPLGSQAGDQKRITTPAQALKDGADYLVIGRPITASAAPREAVLEILREMEQV
jgi:orotidine-5'-phosphate decarboxylase